MSRSARPTTETRGDPEPKAAGGGKGQTGSAASGDCRNCTHHLVVVPGATHLFEEPGALEAVANCAVEWFEHNLEAAPA